jgi:NADH dehydrogenase
MIFITGASGFIGRSLTELLSQQGLAWRPLEGRINNPLSIRPQLEGADVVIHLAGAEAQGRNRLLQHVDVEGTERLLEECDRAQIKRFIVVSRIGADVSSLHPLLRAKGEVEQLVRSSGLPFTVLRSATLYGQSDRFTELAVSLAIWNWPFVWLPGGGKIPMQPLWVEDLVRCLAAAIERTDLINKTVTLAGEERIHYAEILRLLLAMAGYQRIPVKMPLFLLNPLSTLLFAWWWRPQVTRFFIDRFFVPEVAEIDSVLHNFNFRPSRFRNTIGYLRRPGLRWRLFRR